jgi:hypothetical protein
MISGARLLVRGDFIMSAIQVEPPEAHGFADEHFSEFEFLALEERRFLAAIVLTMHPDNGRAYTYPLQGHVDVAFGLDDDALLEAAQQLKVLPPVGGGPAYKWSEARVDVARVLDVVRATQLTDHLLMRGLGALLQADMCFQHLEIREAAVIQLYVALEVSFQMVLRLLRERGLPNPSAIDAEALMDDVFDTGGYFFKDYYEDRVKTMHPSSRFGVFPVAPLLADDYYFLRYGMVEIYHWLITKRRLEPSAT